ncbi:MAG: hypothetical protein V4813_15495 [Gemmatimonadota bacterium]
MLMTRSIAAAFLLVVSALWSQVGGFPHASTHDTRAAFRQGEVHRLQAHFDSVDSELRAGTPATLRPSQRAARAQLIAWLHEYRDAGMFPENDRFAGRRVPFFVDHRGVRCAMGELIHRSGRADLVQSVAATRNNAYIGELADDPRLVAWLDSVGMTVAEAARVQPSYDGSGGGNVIDDVVVTPATGTYKSIATALSVSSLAAIALNVRRPSGLSTWAGLALGTAGVVSGSLRGRDNIRGEDAFTAASVTFGAASLVTGAYRAFNPRVKPTPMAASTARIANVQVAPALLAVGGGRRQPGLTLHATFR